MVNIPIQHIIGTVALIGLVISAGVFYSLFTTSVQSDSKQKELSQISQNVSLNIEEMINLVKFETCSSQFSNYTVKIINLPQDISGDPYQIQLLNGSQLQVNSFLASQKATSATSTIPFNSGATTISMNTTTTVYQISVGADNTKIDCSGLIYGEGSVAVWACPVWDNPTGNAPSSVTIGIGWVDGQS
jgi:hypothetical protein